MSMPPLIGAFESNVPRLARRSVACPGLSLLLALVFSTVTHAGMVCWWAGSAECRVSPSPDAAASCRTPSPDDCKLAWDQDPDAARVVVSVGGIYEVSGGSKTPSGRIFRLEGAYFEPIVRERLAGAFHVSPRSIARRVAWFAMTGGDPQSAMDQGPIPTTELCVATGGGAGVSRLKIWRCAAGKDGSTLVDDVYVADEETVGVPFRDGGRRFVAVLASREMPAQLASPERGGVAAWGPAGPGE